MTHYSVVIGTAYRQWDDGRRTKADDFGPGSGDPSLPADTSTPPLPAPVVVAMHGRGVVDARMAIYDWSGLLRSARPATAAELALPGSATGRGRTGVAVILPSDSRSLLLVWAECGSDTSGTISVTADRSTVILHAAPHYNCGQPGARRGAVLTFASPVPAAVQAVASLPDG